MPTKRRDYYVKLEYRVTATDPRQAVDVLTAEIRHSQTRSTAGIALMSADLQRTDVLRPGDGGEW